MYTNIHTLNTAIEDECCDRVEGGGGGRDGGEKCRRERANVGERKGTPLVLRQALVTEPRIVERWSWSNLCTLNGG